MLIIITSDINKEAATYAAYKLFAMPDENIGSQYSTWVGLIYIFNLIVGTGALTLPAVFSRAGWLLGVIVILILGLISFITVTFVIEAMASANAIIKWNRIQNNKREVNLQDSNESEGFESMREASAADSEDTPLVNQQTDNLEVNEITYRHYVIDEKVEMGEMASIFFNKFGVILFYVCLIVYLFGDLSIYCAAVAKTLANVVCTYIPENYTINDTIPDTTPCWKDSKYNRLDAYDNYLSLFIVVMGPFAFFNVQKTKYLQYLTSAMRWLAFSIMIIFALQKIIANGPQGNPPPVNLSGIPRLFGVCVYSFMCHHSLPALVAPISNKGTLNRSLAFDYLLIAFFYLILALTGTFAFAHVDDLYTLDFDPNGGENISNLFVKIIDYFLTLFPVFTLSTNFPIIAITLRNNLQTLFFSQNRNYNIAIKIIIATSVILLPYSVAKYTKDLSILVGITGSYAGTGIQYLIPTFLIYFARRHTSETIGLGITNKFASPFKSNYWLIFVFVWSIACMILVSVNLIEIHLNST